MVVGGGAMATTLVASLLRFDRVIVAHVGDSRCYLVRQGEAKLLTRDHTVANEHARLGLISAEEVADRSDQTHAHEIDWKRDVCQRGPE